MKRVAIDPGALRTELSLEAPTAVSDGQGGFVEGWGTVGSIFAMLEPVAARGVFGADQALSEVTHRITLRARNDVASGMRFAQGGRAFLILAVVDPDESGRFLACRTREQGR